MSQKVKIRLEERSFASQAEFFLPKRVFHACRANPRSQKNFGALSKTSRAKFFKLFLVFEKNNFSRSHESECSKNSLRLHTYILELLLEHSDS